MDIEGVYGAVRENRGLELVMPPWADLPTHWRGALEAAYALGIHAAASYVDGNWASAGEMAEHLRDVADGKKPMYAE